MLTRPLPLRPERTATASDYRAVPFDRSDPRWGETLTDIAAAGLPAEAWYARTDGGNAPYHAPIAGAVKVVAARESVVERLVAADKSVQPLGLRIKTLDAYRSIETQAGLWAFFEEKLTRERPDLDAVAIEAIVKTFVSDPRRFDPANETTWPIHSTGGSVDVMLIDAASGDMLDHGAGFDEAETRSYTDHYERLLADGSIGADDARLINRRILVNAMVNAGFTNYAYEFWHFDHGTQLHVLTLRESGAASAPDAAWYGTTTLPERLA